MLGDCPVVGQWRREHEADLSLRHQKAGLVPNSSLGPAIANDLEAERGLIVMRRLLRVPDVELDVVGSVDREGVVGLGGLRQCLRSHIGKYEAGGALTSRS